VYDPTSTLIKRTDYVGEFVYEDNELAFIFHEEGRIVPELDGSYSYEYYLKDHLGNTRVVFTTDPKTIDFGLNYESNSADPDDEALFDNLQNVITADIHDRVDAGNESFNHTNVQALNGATNGVIGSVLTIPVGAGDKISAEVYAKYLAPTSTNNPAAAIGNLVIAAITGSTGTNNYEGAINSGYGSSGTVTNLINASASSTEPMAFINLLFLPDDVTGSIATNHFAFKQITSSSSNSQAILALDQPYEAPESGYVVVYLSNESAQLTEVYFDDLMVTVNEHPVIEKQDFYPLGMAHAGGYQRVTAKENRYKFNQGTLEKNFMGEEGKFFRTERITDLDLNVDMTKFRMYDPALGRFWQVDPLADAANQERWTPYHYAFNNPLRYNDPLGNCPPGDEECIAAQQAGSGQSNLEQRQRKIIKNVESKVKDVVNNTTVGGEVKIADVSIGPQGKVNTPVGKIELNVASTKLVEATVKGGHGESIQGSGNWIGKDGKQTITQGAQAEVTGFGSIGGSREIERQIGSDGGRVVKDEGSGNNFVTVSKVKSVKNPSVDSLTRVSIGVKMGAAFILGWESAANISFQYTHPEVREK
ncbi:MAG: RHS repeat-associated core domain-containing protein, partial [Bacteroidota bacterium]